MNRRRMLATLGLSATGLTLAHAAGSAFAETPAAATGGFPVYDVRTFGALGDGKNLDSPAINRAIDAATAGGGGTVYVGPGLYRSGTVVLKSHVTLYLEAGATLLGSADLMDYPPQSNLGAKGDANNRHLIFARDAENITLAGPGRIDGQGATYWSSANRSQPADSWGDVVTFDFKVRPRPSPMLEFYNVTNLRIEDVLIENAAGWTVRPMACTNVFIRGITINNPIHGPNCDGIDPTCCRNLTISDCHISTADDAICLKSEDSYGNPVGVSKNILITNCFLTGCCNGLKFGTATFGGFENVTASNLVIANDDVPINQRIIAGIAIEMVDGGYIDGVTISNVRMQRVRSPIYIRLGGRHKPATSKPTVDVGQGRSFLRGVMIDNIHATASIMTGSVTGLPDRRVEDVTISNLRIDTEEAALFPTETAACIGKVVPEVARNYPEARDFGRLPAHGLYARHVDGLRLRNVEFAAVPVEMRPALVADDVVGLDIDGLRATAIADGGPLLRLIDVRRAFIRGAVAATGTQAMVGIEGEKTEHIVITACDALDAQRPVEIGDEVALSAVLAVSNVAKPEP